MHTKQQYKLGGYYLYCGCCVVTVGAVVVVAVVVTVVVGGWVFDVDRTGREGTLTAGSIRNVTEVGGGQSEVRS